MQSVLIQLRFRFGLPREIAEMIARYVYYWPCKGSPPIEHLVFSRASFSVVTFLVQGVGGTD